MPITFSYDPCAQILRSLYKIITPTILSRTMEAISRLLLRPAKNAVRHLPSYQLVKPLLLELAGIIQRFTNIQACIPRITRRKITRLGTITSAKLSRTDYMGIRCRHRLDPWYFMLCAAASNPQLTKDTADKIFAAFFPWIGGFHILLDYFIDQVEDDCHGDLNFVAYYRMRLKPFHA